MVAVDQRLGTPSGTSATSGLGRVVLVIAIFTISGCAVDGSAALSKGDYVTAARLWRSAAERGDPSAQYSLGVMYDKGQGVPQDRNEALIWYRKSAAQGHQAAQHALGIVPPATVTASTPTTSTEPPKPVVQLLPSQPQPEPAKIISPPQPAATARPAPIRTPTVSVPKAQAAPARVSPPQTASIATPVPPHSSTTSVPMKQQPSGTFAVPVLINGAITLNFMVDSGASDVTIPMDVVLTLMRTGTLTTNDFVGKETYTLADGSRVESRTFRIRSLKVGGKVVENVLGSEAHVKGSLLLGQSFLGTFKSWSIDNTKHALVLE